MRCKHTFLASQLNQVIRQSCFVLLLLFSSSCKTTPKYTDAKVIAGESLIDVCAAENFGAVEEKLRNGVNVNYQSTQFGSTCLHYAAYMGSPGLVEFLLKHGASTNIQDKSGRTPIFDSVFIARTQKREAYDNRVVKILIDNGATKTINIPNNDGQTPLMFACRFHEPEIVKLLLANGADPNLGTRHPPPIGWAMNRGDSWNEEEKEKARKIIEILKAHGAKD